MTIDPQRYKRNKGRRQVRHHRKQINVRLQRAKSMGGPPKRADVIHALEHILDHGEVPKGWRLAAIEWSGARGTGLITGTIDNFDDLRPVIEAALHNARIALVGGG